MSVPNTTSVPDPSRTTQIEVVNRREVLEACFYKRTKYYFPTHDPQAQEFSRAIYIMFSSCYKTEVPNAGILARLPQEILEDIILQLDMDSYRRFRQVSRRTRYLSTAVTVYQRVLCHAPDAINALRRTDLSRHVSYADIYTALTTTKCAFCGLFGDFLFLPTGKRCCFMCLRESPETALVNESSIRCRVQWQALYANHAEDLTSAMKAMNLRTFKTHNWDNVKKMSKTRGVLAKDFLAALIKVDSTMEEPGQALLKPVWLHYRMAASIIFPYLNLRTGKLRTGVSCIGCHLNVWKQGVPTPIFLSNTDLSLTSCFHARDRSYSEDEAALHFSQCPESQRLLQSGRRREQCVFIQEGGAHCYLANEWRRNEENLTL
ncbi:hypothetical protein F52700_5911 [Fusarium sp. NRRL 52700]|nr:hypothetical protein F52700_5911 [Fusarium sp. NRRL 52700]